MSDASSPWEHGAWATQAALVTSEVKSQLKLMFPALGELLIAGPEEERSPHNLGEDWPWVPTFLQLWFLAGCVFCKLIFFFFFVS